MLRENLKYSQNHKGKLLRHTNVDFISRQLLKSRRNCRSEEGFLSSDRLIRVFIMKVMFVMQRKGTVIP